jgi:lysozyme
MNNPSSNPAQGIGASRFQCNLDWPAAKNECFSFAFVKATGGETYVDPCF